MKWVFYGAFALIALVFSVLELVGWRLNCGWTVSELAWRAFTAWGWWAEGPVLAVWLLLGSHLFLRRPHL